MQTFRSIDWSRAWRDDRKANGRSNNPEFWDRRAPSFADHVNECDNDDYIDPFLALLNPDPQWNVLDVGCGPGTLAFPLARKVRQVTALDFSSAMLGYLKERKQSEGVANIDERLVSWEDDWSAAGLQPHDAAIASRSLATDDPRATLEKLMAFAKKRICISFMVGSGPSDPRIIEAVGRPPKTTPDYIYIYNLLYQMGVYANVQMLEKRARNFADADDAFDSVCWMLDQMTPSEEETLRRFISAHLVRDGQRWQFDYKRSVRWAALWWDVE
jgi:SAM-dependent methyltransferase